MPNCAHDKTHMRTITVICNHCFGFTLVATPISFSGPDLPAAVT